LVFRGEQFRTVLKRPADEFFRDWAPSESTLPDWRAIALAVRERDRDRKARAARK
jgi:hypothetical protein